MTKLENQLSESERQLKQEAQARLNAEAAKIGIEQTMLENRGSKAGFWTVIAFILGGLITFLAIRAPTASAQWKKLNVAPKLPNVDQLLGHFERKVSSLLADFPKRQVRHASVNHVTEINVPTQPHQVN